MEDLDPRVALVTLDLLELLEHLERMGQRDPRVLVV